MVVDYGLHRRALLTPALATPNDCGARCDKLSAFFRHGTDACRIEELRMSWVILVLAGVLEIAWAVGLKQSAGFTRLWPSLFTAVSMTASVGLLGLALRHLPLGTAYAVWTGIGTVGTAIAGMILLGEPAGAMRLFSIALIVAGIIGLKILTPA
jgi:quaternary ammonium compound-resistance protein SugE